MTMNTSSKPPTKENPQWSDRNAPPQTKELITLAGMFLCLILLLIWLLNLTVNWLIVQMPVSWERQLGQAIVQVYQPQALDSPIQDKLNTLVDQLESKIPPNTKAHRDYQVLYIPDDVVNALAIPGDTIVVHQGLLASLTSENELMMVLGHEIGHFAHRDHLQTIGKILVIRTVVSTFLGDVTFLADAAQIVTNMQFSQARELAADQYGLELLFKQYGQVVGATDILTRLTATEDINWGFFAPHPTPTKRVAALQDLIATKGYPIGEYTPLPKVLQQS